MKRWCLGFIFDTSLAHVLLLRKGRTLHVGFWNGVGGNIDGSEAPAEAMARECAEETGLKIYPPFWDEVGSIQWHHQPSWRCHVFATWVADLFGRFGPPASNEYRETWPSDTPKVVSLDEIQNYPLAPHTEIFIRNAILKLKDPKREFVIIQEAGTV